LNFSLRITSSLPNLLPLQAEEIRSAPKADIGEGYDTFEEIEDEGFWEQYAREASDKFDFRKRGLKERTPYSSIDVLFDNITVEIEEFPPKLQYSSRINILVRDLRILDNIETFYFLFVKKKLSFHVLTPLILP